MMTRRVGMWALGVSLCALPMVGMAQTTDAQDGTTGANAQSSGHREAMKMVPTRAVLDHELSAKDDKVGHEFRAKLVKDTTLDGGMKLPKGTQLVGHVETDDMNQTGTSKLAVRFDSAVLQDGKTIPVKATIVGLAGPSFMNNSGYINGEGDETPNSWTDGTLKMDQIGVMSGVDLHSAIASQNSGVLVSKTKDNIHLRAGTEVELAIAASHHGLNAMNTGATGAGSGGSGNGGIQQ